VTLSAPALPNAPRDALGRYYTPFALADLIINTIDAEVFGADYPSLVIEPSCGSGAFTSYITHRYWVPAECVAVDIDPNAAGLHTDGVTALCADWLTVAAAWTRPVCAIVGNVPFTQDTGRTNRKGNPIIEQVAERHARACLALAPRVCGLILPWSLAGTVEGVALLNDYPPASIRPITPRPWPNIREVALYLWVRGDVSGRYLPMPRWK
jgi:hypothetical protein